MRTFAKKPKDTQQTTSAKSSKPSRSFVGQSRDVHSIPRLQRTVSNQAVMRLLQTTTENIDANSASSTSTGFSHDFSRIPVYSGTRNTIQPKLKVSAPEVISSPGRSLDSPIRAFMQARFGQDFSDVRVHTDSGAASLAERLNARAFTFGTDIGFASGCYRPGTHIGNRLIAHELAHVIQHGIDPSIGGPVGVATTLDEGEYEARRAANAVIQGDTVTVSRKAGRMVRRDGPATTTGESRPADPLLAELPPLVSFADTWRQFDENRRNSRNQEAIASVPALIRRMSYDDAIRHAGDLALWLIERGEQALATRALNRLEMAWWLRFIDIRRQGLPTSLFSVGPEQLVRRAETLAAGGDHAGARELFGFAFLFLQMRLIASADTWLRQLSERGNLPPGTDFPLIRTLAYYSTRSLFAQLRHIVGYYARQQRSALIAGRTDEAEQLGRLDERLRERLRERFLISGSGEGSEAVTMEATFDVQGEREGYVLHGAGPAGREEFVTPLPGSPRPEQLGHYPAYTVTMSELLETLGGQEAFVNEIIREPQVRRALRGRRVDMNDERTRMLVWRTMYQVYQSRPASGCPTALCSLIRLIERYLRHFTFHVDYDLRDFGPSYLQSEFPQDLLGRAARDCGVYALKVAYEIFRTARQASPRLAVGFQLYFTLDHATLAIHDRSTGDQYLVSNDRITGPTRSDPAGAASTAYASLMGHRHAVSVGARTGVLTTGLSEAAFRREIWQQYRSGVRLTLQPDPVRQGETRSVGERRETAFRQYYALLRRFDQRARSAESQLNVLVRSLAGQPRDAQRRLMVSALGRISALGMEMRDILHVITRAQHLFGLRPGATRPVERIALISTPTGASNTPIVRVALALFFAGSLGVRPTPEQQTLIDWVRQAPWPNFGRALINYARQRHPPVF